MNNSQLEIETIHILNNVFKEKRIMNVKIGYSTILEIATEKGVFRVDLGSPTIKIGERVFSVDSSKIETKKPLIEFYNSVIDSFLIHINGELEITLDNNLKKIISKPGANCEAWELNGPEGIQICFQQTYLAASASNTKGVLELL